MPGPPPKSPSRRARSNRSALDVTWLTVLADPAPQPTLPTGYKWHPQTRIWWKVWGTSPQAAYFSVTDWQSMLTTARIHSLVWNGDVKAATELRNRESLVGGTPSDRARLRMEIAKAEEIEDRAEKRAAGSARARRGALKALPTPEAPAADAGS